MGKKISVCFRVDVGRKLGLGHLSRCRSLMLAFSNLAACHFLVVTNDKELVGKFISGIDFDLYGKNSSFKNKHFDIGIVDVPGIATRKKEKFLEASGLIAAIDDEGPGLPEQDILIRPNLLDLPRPSKIAKNNYWSGWECIILHPDVELQALRKRTVEKESSKLLVCFGGSDPCGLTLRVIPLLKKVANGMKVHVVIGSAFSRKKDVVSMIGRDSRFLLSVNVSNMGKTLRAADVALISGGTLLYEACALGVPSLVLSQNAAQDAEARVCRAAGAVLKLGLCTTVADEAISAGLERIVRNYSLRIKMASKGPRIVAPNGARRIASRLLVRQKVKSNT